MRGEIEQQLASAKQKADALEQKAIPAFLGSPPSN
jgi:hypothetical protein